MSGIHNGHRQRMRLRLKESGMKDFQEHEILEWMLFHTIPREDVNPLAHRLINTFGSLAEVLHADFQALMAVDGVGESTALFLANYLSVYKRCLENDFSAKNPNKRFNETDTIEEFFRIKFLGCKEEVLHALLLDSKFGYLRDTRISEGDTRTVELNFRKLSQECLNAKATYVVLAHNHPSGLLLPSANDERVTCRVKEVLDMLGVVLCDHLIVGPTQCTSMRKTADYAYIFPETKEPKGRYGA